MAKVVLIEIKINKFAQMVTAKSISLILSGKYLNEPFKNSTKKKKKRWKEEIRKRKILRNIRKTNVLFFLSLNWF